MPSVRAINTRVSGSRPASGPEQRAEELFGALRRQGVQPELRVIRAAAPGVLIFRPVVHEQQQPGGRQTLDQPIEQRLGLGVDPVQVFEDDQQRLHLALPQQEPLHRLQGAPAALRRIEGLPLRVLGRHVEQRQKRRQTAFLARSSVKSFPVSFSRTARGPSRSSMAK